MKQPFTILLMVLLSGCIREIDYEVESVPPQLVVNAILKANQPIIVNVSALQSIFDTTNLFINDATVCIRSGEEIDTLTNQGNGDYQSKWTAKEGCTYMLTVNKAGYPQAFASDTIPFISRLLESTVVQTSELDEYGWPIDEYAVSFECNATHPQLYEIMFIKQMKLRDSGGYQLSFISSDQDVDPIIQQFGNNDIFDSYFFNSANIPGKTYTLKMKMKAGSNAAGQFHIPLIPTEANELKAVVLRSISQAYLDYRVAWENHTMMMRDSAMIENIIMVPLIGQQQEMYSNVENGKGIFVSYCQTYFILDE